jgi:hypothetical protein
MYTRDQVLAAIVAGRKSQCLDGRDYTRLSDFFPVAEWAKLGLTTEKEATPEQIAKTNASRAEWTEANILSQLKADVAFGFEKALDQRGISASLMNEVVKMWLWILEDPLQHRQDYEQYGLPLLKAVAVKYNFPNPIGEDEGTEDKYAA